MALENFFDDLVQKAANEAIEDALAKGISGEELEAKVERGAEAVPAALVAGVPGIIDSLKASAPEMLDERRSARAAYSEMIQAHWQEAFDLYEIVLRIGFEVGQDYSAARVAEEEPIAPVVGPVIARLQGRGCRIAEEVLVLMKAGYAQAALVRWRTLHEVSVVAAFISKHGPETARRYLAHENVESFWALQDYIACQPRLGYEPPDPEEIETATANFEAVLDEFGPSFKRQYGWAQDVIAADPALKEIDGIRALEKDVEVDHLRAHYRLASHPAHPHAKGTVSDPDLMPEFEGAVLAGPAPRGMADPGHGALISLTNTTCTLLMLKPGASAIVYMQTLLDLTEEAGEAFAAASRRLDEMGAEGFHNSG